MHEARFKTRLTISASIFHRVARRCTFLCLSVFLSLSVSIFDFPLAVHSFAVFILPSKMLGRMERDGRGSIDNRGGGNYGNRDKVRDRRERERETMKGHRTNRIAFTPLEPYSSLSIDEDLGFHGMQRDLKFSVTSPFTWIHRVYEIYECPLFLFG